jgi:hypothetical protein
MRKDRLVFKITNKGMTRDRMKSISDKEVVNIGKIPRAIVAVGGAYMFFYGTGGDMPESVVPVAYLFAAFGIAAVLLAIFLPRIIELRHFTKIKNQGGFPSEVSVGEGGIYIDEGFSAFSGIKGIAEYKDYFKLVLFGNSAVKGASPAPCLFLFKEDFEQGEPEVFIEYLLTKKSES